MSREQVRGVVKLPEGIDHGNALFCVEWLTSYDPQEVIDSLTQPNRHTRRDMREMAAITAQFEFYPFKLICFSSFKFCKLSKSAREMAHLGCRRLDAR
jgi:hypothetical protein